MIQTNTIQITAEILNLIAGIDEFKGAWPTLNTLAPDRLSSLRQVALLESVGASLRIQGSPMSDRDIARLLDDAQIRSFDTAEAQAAAGCAEIIGLLQASPSMALTENRIQQWHAELLAYGAGGPRGYYKTVASIDRFDAAGKDENTTLVATPPADTPRLMRELMEWFDAAQAETSHDRLHALLRIGIWLAVFLEIRPFEDGNGRLSRALAQLLLIQAGYTFIPYSSLDSVIEPERQAAYLAWSQTQSTIRSATPDWQPWLLFFLRALTGQIDALKRKLEREKHIVAVLPELSLRILEFVKAHGRVTMSQAIRLTGSNRNTLKQHLRTLVELGHLRQQGAGRGVWYQLN